MKLTRILAAAILSTVAATGQIQSGTESRPAADDVATAIKNLDHDSFDVRNQAMDRLRASGEDARAALEAARNATSLEVRTRAETLIRELDDKKSARNLRPLEPEGDRHTGRRSPPSADMPQPGDFSDPRAFIDALNKYMDEVMRSTQIEVQELDLDHPVFRMLEPQGFGGGSVSITTSQDGETVVRTRDASGLTIKVTRTTESGGTETESWTAPDEEAFEKEHPEAWRKYGGKELGVTSRSRLSTRLRPVPPPPPVAPVPTPIAPVPAPVESLGPRLGVFPSEVPAILDKHLKLGGEGMVVDDVVPDTLASRLGIRPLDILVRLDGQAVRTRDDIARILAAKEPPAVATARVIREGAPVELSAKR